MFQKFKSFFKNNVSLINRTKLNSNERKLIMRILKENLTYLTEEKLTTLIRTCNLIKANKLSGLYIEAGCALGGSTILLSILKPDTCPFYVYDVFGMIPPPTENDTQDVHERYRVIVAGDSKGIGDDGYYGYEENLYKIVQKNLKAFGVDEKKESISLIKGLVQETMDINQPVVLAHIDVDWYDPVMTCLKQIFPKLVVGGSIILDDYNDWGGCRKATDEYLKSIDGQFVLDGTSGSLQITKILKE